MNAIRDWLTGIGLEQYADAFEAEEITEELLPDLDHDLLKEIGVSTLGHRLKILRAAAVDEEPAQAPAAPVTSHSLDPERRQLTVMFCDLVGSTKLSTRLEAEDFREVIRAYHERVAGIVVQHGGHVAKFVGDGILVQFGYPVAHEDAAERAVRAGLEVANTVSAMRAGPDIPLAVRVGLATGLVVVGDLTGRGVAEASVVTGEAPNIAEQIQSFAPENGVVLGDATRRLIEGRYVLAPLGEHSVAEIGRPVEVWQVVEETGAEVRFEAAHAGNVSPLVGREEEFARLQEAWSVARTGRGRVSLLRGEAGIGKSRLLRELGDRGLADNAVLLKYQCSEFYSNTAFHPISRHLEHAARFRPGDSDDVKLDKLIVLIERTTGPNGAEEIAALFAAIMSLPLDRLPPLRISPALQKVRTTDALISHVESVAERRPVLMMFEDIHWADPTTMDTLGEFVERIVDAGVHLVVTMRPEVDPPWTDQEHVDLIDLGPLDAAEINRIVDLALEGSEVSPEIRELIFQRTDGVPLFAEELTRSVVEGDYQSEADASRFVPMTLNDTLMARLDRLAPVREIAQLSSVAGREISLNLLKAISDKSEADLRDALGQLEEAGLISKVPGEVEETWGFRHAMIEATAYGSLLRQQRRMLHEKIARALLDKFPERAGREPEYLAHHFTEAGAPADAAPLWLKAGKVAWQRAAAKEALAHLEKGLAQVAEIGEEATRDPLELQLQSTIGVVHFAATSYASEPAQAAFLRAREICDRVGDLKAQFAVIYGVGAFETMRGDMHSGDKTFAPLMDMATEIGDPRYEVYASSMFTWTGYNCARFAESAKYGARLLELYGQGAWDEDGPRISAADPRVISDIFYSGALWALGRPDEALAVDKGVIEHAHRTDDPYNLVYAYATGCRVFGHLEDWQTAFDRSVQAMEMADEYGYGFLGAFASVSRARALIFLNDPGKAAETIVKTRKTFEAAGVRYNASLIRALQAQTLARTGKFDEALEVAADVPDLIEETGEYSCAAETRLMVADVLRLAGRHDDASAMLRDAAVWSDRLGSPRLVTQVSVASGRVAGRSG